MSWKRAIHTGLPDKCFFSLSAKHPGTKTSLNLYDLNITHTLHRDTVSELMSVMMHIRERKPT